MGNNRPRIPVSETLQGLKVKLLEGKDYADTLRDKFGREKIQSERMISHIQHNVRSEIKIKRFTRETAGHLIHRLGHLYKKSRKHISKVQKYLAHVHENETRFSDEQTDFNDLQLKVESILQELDCAILELRQSEDDTDDENNEMNSDDETSGINGGSAGAYVNDSELIRPHSHNHDRYKNLKTDFKLLCKASLILEIESNNYKMLRQVCV
ncbi:unnamed protein product [Mytilus coruscus]|uniref:Uncharacterized protein n=1 Tax=Mytilus coruscus TaxID=42192 RepID=A0A6J8AJD1_MYTCO|nr:unnamed protein product [Mytilus coruscus]